MNYFLQVHYHPLVILQELIMPLQEMDYIYIYEYM